MALIFAKPTPVIISYAHRTRHTSPSVSQQNVNSRARSIVSSIDLGLGCLFQRPPVVRPPPCGQWRRAVAMAVELKWRRSPYPLPWVGSSTLHHNRSPPPAPFANILVWSSAAPLHHLAVVARLHLLPFLCPSRAFHFGDVCSHCAFHSHQVLASTSFLPDSCYLYRMKSNPLLIT